jgi:hypothetical protein
MRKTGDAREAPPSGSIVVRDMQAYFARLKQEMDKDDLELQRAAAMLGSSAAKHDIPAERMWEDGEVLGFLSAPLLSLSSIPPDPYQSFEDRENMKQMLPSSQLPAPASHCELDWKDEDRMRTDFAQMGADLKLRQMQLDALETYFKDQQAAMCGAKSDLRSIFQDLSVQGFLEGDDDPTTPGAWLLECQSLLVSHAARDGGVVEILGGIAAVSEQLMQEPHGEAAEVAAHLTLEDEILRLKQEAKSIKRERLSRNFGKLVGRLLHRACKEYVNLLDYASFATQQVLEKKEQQLEYQRVKYEQLLADQQEEFQKLQQRAEEREAALIEARDRMQIELLQVNQELKRVQEPRQQVLQEAQDALESEMEKTKHLVSIHRLSACQAELDSCKQELERCKLERDQLTAQVIRQRGGEGKGGGGKSSPTQGGEGSEKWEARNNEREWKQQVYALQLHLREQEEEFLKELAIKEEMYSAAVSALAGVKIRNDALDASDSSSRASSQTTEGGAGEARADVGRWTEAAIRGGNKTATWTARTKVSSLLFSPQLDAQSSPRQRTPQSLPEHWV